MNIPSEMHVVLGGTGAVGSATMTELVKQGKRIRSVSRNMTGDVPNGVERMVANIANSDEARNACRGATHIYFCVSVPYTKWASDFPHLMDGAIAAATETGAKLIVADNLYVYPRTTQPMTETMPWDPSSHKGKVRKGMDEHLVAASDAGTIRMVIGRASDFHGPLALSTSTLGELFFNSYFANKTVNWIGKLDVLHTFSYVLDFGRGLVTLGAHDQTLGQAWHIPAAEPLSSQQFLDIVSAEGGQRVKVNATSGRMLGAIGIFNPMLREVAEMAYEFEAPFVMDTTKFARVFGSHPTPHRESIRATIDWFRAHDHHEH